MKTPRSSPLALALLSLLCEAPMHPYRMQQLIVERAKDQVVNVRQRASLYQTIERLLRAGLIAVRETVRSDRRPERTIYEITDAGRETAVAWMRAMLSTPAREFPEFPAALAQLPLLTPDDAADQLERRAERLDRELTDRNAKLRDAAAVIPRLFLVEVEYERATLAAELDWVRGVVADIRAGRLTWSEEWLRQIGESLTSPETTERSDA